VTSLGNEQHRQSDSFVEEYRGENGGCQPAWFDQWSMNVCPHKSHDLELFLLQGGGEGDQEGVNKPSTNEPHSARN
jgi:hypothetical protein